MNAHGLEAAGVGSTPGGARSSASAPSPAARLAILLIHGYQLAIGPMLPPVCRFWPTCSRYGAEAFARYGFWRGGWLTLQRLARCQPWDRGGYDPVI